MGARSKDNPENSDLKQRRLVIETKEEAEEKPYRNAKTREEDHSLLLALLRLTKSRHRR
jgi:hypothetical protein